MQVVSLKGQTINNLKAELNTTVGQLKYHISSRMPGQQVNDMRLIYKAKPLAQLEDKTLAQIGMKAGGQEQLHVVARFVGGTGHRDRSAVQEIAYQLKFVKQGKLHNVTMIEPEDEWTWNMMMRGPKGTVYESGLFGVTITFPQDYPYSPPMIKFNTPIYHPNVFSDGKLCWHENDTGGSKYFADILIGAINCLMETPNPNSPANSEAARLLVSNKDEYLRRALAHTRQHAWS